MDNQVSFTSKIKFVDKKSLKNISQQGARVIHFVPPSISIVEADKFCTYNIRTCTGGGAIIPHQRAKGFHIYDSKINNDNIKDLSNNITSFNPERALLIGSKDAQQYGFPYSKLNFQELKKNISKKVKNVTLFEEYNHKYAESSFCYSKEKDTWYICTGYRKNNKYIYVNSPETMLEAFKNIKISNGDKLFIKEQQVLPKDYPHIFECTLDKPQTTFEYMKKRLKLLSEDVKKFFYG